MKKLLALLAVIVGLACLPSFGVTAHVQSCTAASGACNTTCTISCTSVGANLLTVGVNVNGSTSITVNSVSDGTNSFTKVTSSPCTNAAVTGRSYIWYFNYGSAPGTRTITITVSASATVDRWASEFSGSSGVLDTDACGVDATISTAITTPSVTPTVAGDVLYATCVVGATITAKTGSWTAETVTNGNNSEWQVNVGTSAIAVGFTQNASNDWVCAEAAFKAAGGAANAGFNKKRKLELLDQ